MTRALNHSLAAFVWGVFAGSIVWSLAVIAMELAR